MTALIKIKEQPLHAQIITYLKLQYPKVIFRTDFSSGCKMTIGQAVRHKSLQSSRAFPDIQICEPRTGQKIIEDCKGMHTQEYRRKRRLMKNIYGITIFET